MKFSFTVTTILRLDHQPGASTSYHNGTDIRLDVSVGMDAEAYIEKGGLPNQEGSKVITNVLVQGLVANIHSCHQKGFRDSAEHLRFIIAELERGFIHPAKVSEGIMRS